jgi:hypothetical protein
MHLSDKDIATVINNIIYLERQNNPDDDRVIKVMYHAAHMLSELFEQDYPQFNRDEFLRECNPMWWKGETE